MRWVSQLQWIVTPLLLCVALRETFLHGVPLDHQYLLTAATGLVLEGATSFTGHGCSTNLYAGQTREYSYFSKYGLHFLGFFIRFASY